MFATRGVAMCLLWGFGAFRMVQFGVFWSIFSSFFYFQKSKKNNFFIKIIINCNHVLARGSRSMVHSPLIIFIKGCNL